MASLNYFKSVFCPKIDENWPKMMTEPRSQAIWNAIKNMHDDALAKALNMILRETRFPGVDEIITACSNENAFFKKKELQKQYQEHQCTQCSSGIRVVNNVSYTCNACSLGKSLYPTWPVYAGQTEGSKKVYFEDEYEVREEGNYIFRNKIGSKSIRDCSFRLKTSEPVKANKPNNVHQLKRYGDDF